jgi:hypothetical protein
MIGPAIDPEMPAPWDLDPAVRDELLALLAELEARLEAKEARWQAHIPGYADPGPLSQPTAFR